MQYIHRYGKRDVRQFGWVITYEKEILTIERGVPRQHIVYLLSNGVNPDS